MNPRNTVLLEWVKRLWAQGATYREIGDRCGISHQRVDQLIVRERADVARASRK